MRTVLAVFGAIFLALIVLVVASAGLMAWSGRGLDAQSKAYVDKALPTILAGWEKERLVERASPEFLQATTEKELDNLMEIFRRLGTLQSYDGSQGESRVGFGLRKGKVVTAAYLAKATFDTGPASIKIELVRREGEWRIVSLHIDSKVFHER